MQTQKCNISVIIPVKNRANLLVFTLDNLLNQTLPPSEIIVVDDNSSDDLPLVINNYKGRVIFTKNEGNGPGAARNTGLKMATGEFIKFFDSDDLMTLNTLESQYDILNNKNTDIVYSPYIHASQQPDGTWIRQGSIIQYNPIPAEMTIRECMAYNFFTVIPGFMFRATFLRKLGEWRTDITAYEDWDYLWRIGKLCPSPVHTNSCAMIYRIHGLQTTGVHFNDLQRDKEKIKCLTDAIKDTSDLSLMSKLALKNIIWQTLKKINYLPEYEIMFKKYDGLIMRVVSYRLRLKNKIERIKTRSEWTTMHGVNTAEKEWVRYSQLLDISSEKNTQ